MSIIKAIAFTAFVIAIPLFLIIMNLRVVVNTPLLYSYGFDQYEIERVTGIERSDLILAGRQIRDYFNNEERWLNVQVPIRGGEPEPLYNTTELLHMWDVKVLIRTLYNVQLIVGLYIVLFIPVGLALAPRAFPRILMRLIAWGAGLTLAIVFVTGLLSLTGFSQTFYAFHVIAFTNDLWKLDPARDYLIAMFPEGFFFDATMVLAALTVIQGLWIFCLSMSALKRLSASLFFKLTIVQTLSAVVAAVFILRVYPDGFFFEAVMIVVVASVAQALVALVAWRRAPSKATSASASKNDEGSESRSTSSSGRSQEKSEQQQGSERTESLANNAILGYYLIEAVLLFLIPLIQEWRSARRVEASSADATP
ncbi:MAG: TIGR01906 family membrane protein [Dehalococcoidia bacterium]|nr:TIGR01906 family membrane protein [Dehalococcoidia bacterium]